MTQTQRATTWEMLVPALPASEITSTSRQGKMVASANFKPVLSSLDEIGFLAIKFALDDGTTRTVFLDQFAAQAIGSAIDGLNQIGWKTAVLKPKGPAH